MDYNAPDFKDYYWSQNSILSSMKVEYTRTGQPGGYGDFGRYEGNQTTNIKNPNERIKEYSANGHASFAAFVALYSELVPQELYKDIIKYPTEKILRYYDESSPLFRQSRTDKSHIDEIAVPYNMKCFQHFVACLKNKPLAEELSMILCQHPTDCMQLDYGKWEDGYEELPCDIVQSPDSVIYPAVKDLVDKSLSYLIRQQKEDGAWHLTWRFGSWSINMKCILQCLY